MIASQRLARFRQLLEADQKTSPYVGQVFVMLRMLGSDEAVAQVLDEVAQAWAASSPTALPEPRR